MTNGFFLPEVGKLKSHLYKSIWTHVMLLWHVFSKMRKHEHLHVQVVHHSDETKKRVSCTKRLINDND